MNGPSFPPLFHGMAIDAHADPFEAACAEAIRGCDAGLVAYATTEDALRAALVFSPDVPLAEAMVMLPRCGVGFQNALGALAPPEVAVHLEWAGVVRINGASCGKLRVAASHADPNSDVDWLVVGLEVPLWPESDDPGACPDRTTLYAEGCADIEPDRLLESWVKHTLVGINTWSDEGNGPLHKIWSGLAHGIGKDATVRDLTGTFLGVDEQFGMLLRTGETTHLIPLTDLLETT